jgi:hypothetical protein
LMICRRCQKDIAVRVGREIKRRFDDGSFSI